MPPLRRLWRAAQPVPTLGAGTWAAAGNRFTKLRVVPPVPLGAYRGKISSVPLTGGQAQGQIAGITGTSGSVTSPGAFVGITGAANIPVAGTYTVNWTVTLGGTAGAGDANGFIMLVFPSAAVVATSVNAGAAGTYPQAPVTAAFNAGDFLVVFSGATPTAGSVYSAVIASEAKPLTLTAGPQGLGTVWYPAQVTMSTQTGVLDTSTATAYLGIGGVPTMQVASVFSGNGVAALAVPPLQPGELIIVTWVNGHAGDIATFNILGTMDALTTGRGS